MYSIKIFEKTQSHEDMVLLLREIMEQVAEGFTSGYNPHWELVSDKGEDELPN